MFAAGKWCVLGVGLIGAAMAFLAAERPAQKAAPDQPPTTAGPTFPGQIDPAKKPTVEGLRKEYPLESVAGRLDYEPAGAEAFAKSDPPPRTTAETMKRLGEVEKGMADSMQWGMRVQSLKMLHSSEAQKFIDRDGFGFSRMPTPSTMYLALPTAPTIPFATARDAAYGDREENPPGPKTAGKAPKDEALADFQRQGAFNFLNPNGFGFIKDRDHVAGFQPHQFRQMPVLPAEDAPGRKMEQWAVIRLELVSLLKHEQPVAYVTNGLPRMEDVKGAETRPLIPFEEKALKALKEGDDIATESHGDGIRMLGSLRAGKQCLDCHQVKRGDLLGAFSWELQRQPAKEQPAP